jgi:adenylate cyclase
VESLAEGGGICIAGTVHDHVKNKLGLEYEYLGEQAVKNIPEPVHVYRVLSFPGAAAHRVVKAKEKEGRKWRKAAMAVTLVLFVGAAAAAVWNFYLRPPSPALEPASEEKMAYPLPEKPSIAVLPFVNISGDPKQEYLSDGITEQIITTLSKISEMFVISRNSTFTYKGKPVKVKQVSEELGVRYVLEGSVQKEGNQLRMTAQLVDALTGHHLWAERYDRDVKDIFALQDEIAKNILEAMQVKLTEGERARMWGKGTQSLDAYLKMLQALEAAYRQNPDDNALARQLSEEAISLDPEYARPYLILSSTYLSDIWFGLSKSPSESLKQAEQLAQKALALDPSVGYTHLILGGVYLLRRQHELSIAEMEKAIAKSPSEADAYASLGHCLTFAGRPEEAIPLIKKAIRLNPFPQAFNFQHLGQAYRVTGRYEEAIESFKIALQREPNYFFPHISLAVTYILSGREEEARAEAREVLRINPKFSVEQFAKTLPFKNEEETERVCEALRKAGLQ